MSSLRRTTSLLVSKESDGRIAYNTREKEDSLSLKMGEQTFCISFSFLPLHVFLSCSFSPFFSFLFAYLFLFLISHLTSLSLSPHFLFSFSHFLSLFGATTHSVKKEKISSRFPLTICVAIKFPSLFLISLFPFYDIINQMAQCEPWDSFFHTWLIVSHSFKWTTWLFQVSLS